MAKAKGKAKDHILYKDGVALALCWPVIFRWRETELESEVEQETESELE